MRHSHAAVPHSRQRLADPRPDLDLVSAVAILPAVSLSQVTSKKLVFWLDPLNVSETRRQKTLAVAAFFVTRVGAGGEEERKEAAKKHTVRGAGHTQLFGGVCSGTRWRHSDFPGTIWGVQSEVGKGAPAVSL